MITVIDSAVKGERTYYLAETPLGRVLYYQFGEYTQWRNLTLGDFFWSVIPTAEFEAIHGAKPVETFASKRLAGFSRDKIKVDCGGNGVYHLAAKSKPDGYLYEIPATDLRAFTKKDYPEMKFVYTRYHLASIKTLDYLDLERLKTEEVTRFNGNWDEHAPSVVSAICDAVWRYVNERKAAK